MAILALVMPGLVLISYPFIRWPLGVAQVLFIPGYTFLTVLFPKRNDLDGVTRAALSIGLSIVILPILALIINALPWGIRPWPMVISLSIWVLSFCGIGLWRRRSLVLHDQAYLPPEIHLMGLRQALRPISMQQAGTIISMAVGVFAIAMMIFGFLKPAGDSTEFYVLGESGLGENYPHQVSVGDDVSVNLGLVNHMKQKQDYRVEVWVLDSIGSEHRILAAQEGPFTLLPAEKREWVVHWRMPNAGQNQRVLFLLFAGDKPEPYRQLHLWLNVVDKVSQNRDY